MDPHAVPCVIQALPAVSPTSITKPKRKPLQAQPELAPPSPRRTRSGEAPEWSTAETLALVSEVASVDDGWARSVSSFQKWGIVAENLAAAEAACGGGSSRRRRGRGRAASECRRRWETLAAEYGAIRRWEMRGGGDYWKAGAAARRKAGLPAVFDVEVYGAMDALIRVEEALLAVGGEGGEEEEVEGLVGAGGDGEEVEEGEGDLVGGSSGGDQVGEEEEDEEMEVDGGNADACDDLGCNDKSQSNAWELANKLQENAQHIHTILKEEADEDTGRNHALADSISPDAMEIARGKADDLIKSLGGLVSYLNQFSELIKEHGFENVLNMN